MANQVTRTVLIAVLAFLVGVTWCARGGDPKAERAAAILADSIRRLEQRDSLRRVDSVTTAARLQTQQQEARRLAILRAQQMRRADSLAQLVPAHDTAAWRALAAKDVLIQTITAERDTARAMLALTARALTVSDSLKGAWRGVALAAQAQLGAALKRGGKRWACVGGLGVSAGYGVGSGLSFTCGRTL